MGYAERNGQKKQLEADKKQIEKSLKYLNNLKELTENSAPFKESVIPLIAEMEETSYRELTEESTRNKEGRHVPVEPVELVIRQRVHNRMMIFFKQFKFLPEKLEECLNKMAEIEKDEAVLNEEVTA